MARESDLINELNRELRAGQAVTDAFDDAVAERIGINRTDLRCLDIVARAGKIGAGDLGRASGLTSGAVTAVLDRMERAGFCRRSKGADDRRRVFVETTAKFNSAAREAYAPVLRQAQRELKRFTVKELDAIGDFLRLDRELKQAYLDRR